MTASASALPATVVSLPAGTQLPQNPAGAGAATLTESDFLKLLTTQLEHQDPLNPQSPSEFAAELAQFSTASGVNGLNASIAATNSLLAAGLVGHSVAVPGHALQLGKTGNAKGAFSLAAAASAVVVKITDPQGATVATLELGPGKAGNQNFTWDGRDKNGKALPPGSYSFSITATDARGAAVAATPYSVVAVTAVSAGGRGDPLLQLADGAAPVALGAVQQVF
jgi:flagellar basal-body rod modification protein FlgD